MPFYLKPVSLVLSSIHYLLLGLILVVFHLLQWLAFNLGGYHAHKKVVDLLNYFTLLNLRVIGAKTRLIQPYALPLGRPIIFVSNHQSLYDIPGVGWYFRHHHVKYISKMSLGRGIPAISYNLKHGGSVLIDRKKPNEAMERLKKFGRYVSKHHYSALIFPEGTRSRDGRPRRFKKKGVYTLVENIPNALIVPIAIHNSWKLLQYGPLQMPLGLEIIWEVLRPVECTTEYFDAQFALIELSIKEKINESA